VEAEQAQRLQQEIPLVLDQTDQTRWQPSVPLLQVDALDWFTLEADSRLLAQDPRGWHARTSLKADKRREKHKTRHAIAVVVVRVVIVRIIPS